MRRIVLATVVLAAACGGQQIPVHNGYKPNDTKPWKKAKAVKLDDKGEGKIDGDLNYGKFKRARWFSVDVPSTGELDLRLEITPPGENTNEDFDLALEVLDPGNRVISKSDLEDEDAHELTKTKQLFDLIPGKYLIHLYLQGRLDTADYVLSAMFKPSAPAETKSDFPAKVQFVGALPMVPLNDDTPKGYKATQVAAVKIPKRPRGPTPPKPDKPAPVAAATNARVIGLSVVSGGTLITLGIGTAQGVAAGWHGKISGVQGTFSLSDCNERLCKATVSATPDQIKAGGGNVSLSP